ncbi:MAG: DUF3592 domain-containing protein [Pirellulales bacterium]
MARILRPYGKKRGERRTGSKRLGSYGEALFFLCVLAMGAAGLYVMLAEWILPEWRANQHFAEAECTVLGTRVGTRQVDNGIQYYPEVWIRYRAQSQQREAWTYKLAPVYVGDRPAAEALIEGFEVGQTYPCWYDPQNAERAVLVRQYTWWLWLLLVVPASFVILGSAGLVRALLHTSTSAERRAALVQRAAGLELFEDNQAMGERYPGIPRPSSINDSPGTHLAYRLPIDVSPGWKLLGVLLICLFWNGIVGLAIGGVVSDFVAGRGSWLAAAFLVPFAIVGMGFIVALVRQVLVTSGVGGVRLEVSDHPLVPGEAYTLFFSQSGRLRMNSLAILLVCEEEATYRQGTDTRTARQRVFEKQLYRRESFQVRPGMPFEDECELVVPEAAMHSFQSQHNEVKWELLVRGDVAGWPDYERRFSIVVYPQGARVAAV